MSLTHEEVEEMIPAAALDILTPSELEQVLAHVRDHPECAKVLQEYREAAAALALDLPDGHLDPAHSRAMRARLLARARIGNSASLSTSRWSTFLIYRWSGWMVAAGLTAVLLAHHSVHRPLDYGWLASGILVVVLLAVGAYAHAQRRRVAALEDHLSGLASEKKTGKRVGG